MKGAEETPAQATRGGGAAGAARSQERVTSAGRIASTIGVMDATAATGGGGGAPPTESHSSPMPPQASIARSVTERPPRGVPGRPPSASREPDSRLVESPESPHRSRSQRSMTTPSSQRLLPGEANVRWEACPPAKCRYAEQMPGPLAGSGTTACRTSGMTCRVQSTRENRRFSCLEKVSEDFFHGQLGGVLDPATGDRMTALPSPAGSPRGRDVEPDSQHDRFAAQPSDPSDTSDPCGSCSWCDRPGPAAEPAACEGTAFDRSAMSDATTSSSPRARAHARRSAGVWQQQLA
jgi:hypothetical protein